MASNAIYTVKFRRKREGRTNYKKRLELLKSNTPRLVIRKSNMLINTQIIIYHPDGDKIITGFSSMQLKNYKWPFSKNSVPAAYLTGLVIGTLAKKRGITNAIVDLGLQLPKKCGRLYAVVKGAIDAGLIIPVDNVVFPSEDRLNGEHIKNFSALADKATSYKKNKADISNLPEIFLSVKQTILGKGE
jgi:large subunit ribosomal protein L18